MAQPGRRTGLLSRSQTTKTAINDRQLITTSDINELSMSVIERAAELAAVYVARALTGKYIPLPGRSEVVWNEEVRETFVSYMRESGKDEKYIKWCVSYLDRYATKPIRGPKDVLEMFNRCTGGKHHLDRAFRNLLKVYKLYYNLPKDVYEELKEAIPRTRTGVDKYVPSEEEIVETFRKLREMPVEFQAVYNIILDSPSRPTHVIEVLKNWDEKRLRKAKTGEFYIYEVNMVKRTKACFRLHITPETLELVRKALESGFNINRYKFKVAYRRGVTRLKYVRKFAMNAMHSVGLTLDVIRLLAGEKPRTVLEQHYIDVERMAEQQYPKYLAYLAQLRRRI